MDGDDLATVAGGFPSGSWAVAGFCGPNGGNCVQVNLGIAGVAGVRDSKSVAGSVLVFAGEEWVAFLGAAKSGRFDRG
jgi:hypothetical protein